MRFGKIDPLAEVHGAMVLAHHGVGIGHDVSPKAGVNAG